MGRGPRKGPGDAGPSRESGGTRQGGTWPGLEGRKERVTTS